MFNFLKNLFQHHKEMTIIDALARSGGVISRIPKGVTFESKDVTMVRKFDVAEGKFTDKWERVG